MDPVRSSRDGRPTKLDVIMLADCEHRPAGRVRKGDGDQAVVGAGGQVDDDAIDVRERGLEAG